jgi:hypothetical protein
MHMPPTTDPMDLKKPAWARPKSGGGLTVDTQAVVTERSVSTTRIRGQRFESASG